jgi:hypothetical protein
LVSILRLADVAASQWGLVTTAQAGAVGVSPQSVAKLARDHGALERLAHGVYRLAGSPADPFDDLRAAWLALDPARTAGQRLAEQAPDVVSDRSAAVLFGYGNLDADRHDFTVPTRRQSRRPDVRFHRRALGTKDWTIRGGLPVTTPAITIRDLAAAHLDGDHLAGIVRDAVLDGGAHPDDIAAALRPHAHTYGAPLGDGTELLHRLLVKAGVPSGLTAVVALVGARRADRGLGPTT